MRRTMINTRKTAQSGLFVALALLLMMGPHLAFAAATPTVNGSGTAIAITPSSTMSILVSTQTAKTISACGDITQGGDYVLDRDIVATNNGECITVHDTSNVNIDCQDHIINSIDSAIHITNVDGFSVTGCMMKFAFYSPRGLL